MYSFFVVISKLITSKSIHSMLTNKNTLCRFVYQNNVFHKTVVK